MASNAQAVINADPNNDFCTRRKHERVFCAGQKVRLSIRLRGEMRSHRADLLDISAFGAAVSLTRPLSAERTAFLSLSWGKHRIKDVVCTISNCLQTSKTNALLTGYRCGLSFRPSSPLQLDRQETVTQLNALTDELAAAISADRPVHTDHITVEEVGAGKQPGRSKATRGAGELRSSDSGPLPPARPAA